MGFVRHDDNIVVGIDWLHIRLVELLDQRKDEARVAFQFIDQVVAAGRNKLACFCFSKNTTVFEGVADLCVQFVAVGQDHDSGRAGELAANLLRQKHHGIAFAAALGMPEHAQLTVVQLSGFVGFDCLVHAEILVVPGQYLCRMSSGMVKEDKVFQQIQEIFLFANAAKHGFQRHAALFLLRQTLPFMEELILAAQRTDLGFRSIGEDQESVVVEQMGNGVEIIGVVVGVGILHVHRVLLQFNKQQRNPIDETDNIRAAAVQVTVDLQLFDGEEMVVIGIPEVDDRGIFGFCPAAGLLHCDGDAVTNQEIFFLVDLQQGGGGQSVLQCALSLVHLSGCDPRIQAQQSLTKIPGQQNLPVALAAKRAVFAQLLRVVGKGDLPAQLVFEQVTGAFLDEDIFGIVVAHAYTSFLREFRSKIHKLNNI